MEKLIKELANTETSLSTPNDLDVERYYQGKKSGLKIGIDVAKRLTSVIENHEMKIKRLEMHVSVLKKEATK